LVLHTTLDGPSSVLVPALGTGSGAVVTTTPANDFVSARIGAGLRTDAIGERILLPQTDGNTANVELQQGTIEFWYQPNYNHNNNRKYSIVGTGNWPGSAGHGSLHLGKHNDTNSNMLFLIFFDASGVRWEHNVSASDYSWNAGDWLLMRVTWDFNVPAGEQNLHLYVNGRELPLKGQVSRGRQPVPAERSDEKIYIGSRDVTGNIIAHGIYDEVRIWKQVIRPQ
ncbi:MAG: LamG-like jellyroll fold domain-containing protein, partial [Gemmatimonadaceae bacterium]